MLRRSLTSLRSRGGGLALPPSFLSSLLSLASSFPGFTTSSNPSLLQQHGKGESHHPSAPPCLVCSPADTSQVQALVRLCGEHGVPVVPHGAGTSLEGHLSHLDPRPSISLSLNNLAALASLSVPSRTATAGAGLTRLSLNEQLRGTGLHFSVDPGADASLGGMAACAASGTSAVHYGTMRDAVRAMTVVTAGGEQVNTGSLASKSAAGYDLNALYVQAKRRRKRSEG